MMLMACSEAVLLCEVRRIHACARDKASFVQFIIYDAVHGLACGDVLGMAARYNHLILWKFIMSLGLSAFRTLICTLTCASLVVLSACSSSPNADRTDAWSPNKIYAEAKDEAKSGAWDKAIPLFERLEGRAAGTPLAQQAQLEKAFASA